eukprot:4295070-Amphidinium_carterae.2
MSRTGFCSPIKNIGSGRRIYYFRTSTENVMGRIVQPYQAEESSTTSGLELNMSRTGLFRPVTKSFGAGEFTTQDFN